MADQTPERLMAKAAMLPATIVAILALIVAPAVKGWSGFWGAALAALVVLIFFAINIAISYFATSAEPMAVMALALFSYFTKLLFLGVALLLVTRLTQPSAVNRPVFAFSAFAITLGWLIGEIRGFLSIRFQMPLPPTTIPTPPHTMGDK
jgi:hypothetical protein